MHIGRRQELETIKPREEEGSPESEVPEEQFLQPGG